MKFLFPNLNSELSLESPVPDSIPYACHYNKNTILTKNGELIQIIKVTGFLHEKVGQSKLDLRTMVRKAIAENVKSDDYAFWFHTVRRKKSLEPGGNFTPGFANDLDDAWRGANNWDSKYVNELYISVISHGKAAGIMDFKSIVGAISFSALKRSHFKFQQAASKKLNQVTDGMLKSLERYGAKRLSMYKAEDGVVYSQPLNFFSKILNLVELPIPVPMEDLSERLATHKIAFGFDTIEVISNEGKCFAAIFTIKEYHEMGIGVIDNFLQLPQEFMITQTLDFINAKDALEEFQEQMNILEISGDKDFAKDSGLADVVASDRGQKTDFGSSQLTIMLFNNDFKSLEDDIAKATGILAELGMVATRRDLRLEECFWAQLPANFSYISRRKSINTSKVGGFASLYNFPAGQQFDNLWGPAVSIFYTASDTPYFFNFHDHDNGHTLIMGPYGMGKTVLLNFLVAQARKFHGRLYYFDYNKTSKVFIKALDGVYVDVKIDKSPEASAFNPMMMNDTPENRAFLKRWMVYLAESMGSIINSKEKGHLEKIVDYACSLTKEKRKLSTISEYFGQNSPGSLGEKMSIWHGGGKYAHIFDNDVADIVDFNENRIYGFDMADVVHDGVTLGPVLYYLLYRIEMSLDGIPTMIVLDEAWSLVNNPIFAPYLEEWLDKMRAKNAIVIFASEAIDDANKSQITPTIVSKIATQIFLPNPLSENYVTAYRDIWGLSDDEFDMLVRMDSDNREFMLRQGGKSVVAKLDLSGMKEMHILSGSEKTAMIMDEVVGEKGDILEDWLPDFYERVNDQT